MSGSWRERPIHGWVCLILRATAVRIKHIHLWTGLSRYETEFLSRRLGIYAANRTYIVEVNDHVLPQAILDEQTFTLALPSNVSSTLFFDKTDFPMLKYHPWIYMCCPKCFVDKSHDIRVTLSKAVIFEYPMKYAHAFALFCFVWAAKQS